MKITISTIILSLVSTLALASGDHAHKHDDEKSTFAVGEPGSGHIDRRISVSMVDTMRFIFTPGLDSIKDGESIEFLVRNDGKIKHEFSIGNTEEQMAHAEMMRKVPYMHHDVAISNQ